MNIDGILNLTCKRKSRSYITVQRFWERMTYSGFGHTQGGRAEAVGAGLSGLFKGKPRIYSAESGNSSNLSTEYTSVRSVWFCCNKLNRAWGRLSIKLIATEPKFPAGVTAIPVLLRATSEHEVPTLYKKRDSCVVGRREPQHWETCA